MGTGCKPVGSAYLGSNPRAPTILEFETHLVFDQVGFSFHVSFRSCLFARMLYGGASSCGILYG